MPMPMDIDVELRTEVAPGTFRDIELFRIPVLTPFPDESSLQFALEKMFRGNMDVVGVFEHWGYVRVILRNGTRDVVMEQYVEYIANEFGPPGAPLRDWQIDALREWNRMRRTRTNFEWFDRIRTQFADAGLEKEDP